MTNITSKSTVAQIKEAIKELGISLNTKVEQDWKFVTLNKARKKTLISFYLGQTIVPSEEQSESVDNAQNEELERLREQLASLQKENEIIKNINEELQEENESLERDIQDLGDNANDAERDLENLNEENQKLRRKLGKLQEKCEKLEEQNHDLENENEGLKDRIESLTEAKEQMTIKNREYYELAGANQAKVLIKISQISRLKEKVKELQSKIDDTLPAKIRQLQEQVSRFTSNSITLLKSRVKVALINQK